MNKLFIKNMVCPRCIMAVQHELDRLNIPVKNIELGEVTLGRPLSIDEKTTLGDVLTGLGFKLIDDRKSQIIEQIKTTIIDFIHHRENEKKYNLSEILSTSINQDYNYLSNLFSAIEGITIEKYVIAQKIEKVKELLVYDELTLSEIAYLLNYSSVAYLSNQFKKVTGLTPSHFKRIKASKRKALDKI